MLDAGVFPLDPYENTHAPWRSMCLTCGREVSPSHEDVGESGNGCAYCTKSRVDPEEAEAKMRSIGLKPHVRYPGARRPWPSTCMKCNRTVKPQWQNIIRGGGGCVYCAERASEAMPQGGHSETVALEAVSLIEIDAAIATERQKALSN